MFFNKQVFDSISIDGDTPKSDRWIASSLLQKSIRRGDAELAQQAAFHLLELDKTAIWRRLIVIAFEDVGAGDLDALLEAVFVAGSSEWRRGCGEAAALGLATRRLAEAVKDRSGDYLICAAKDHFDLSETCDSCRKASLEQRLELLADSSLPLAKRAVAAWFASGINWRYDRQVRGGDIGALAGAYRELGADKELADAVVLAAKRAPEPLVALVPLIWLEVQRGGPISVRSDPVPETKTIAGVPLYAFDKHTRLGKRAIERLVSENKPGRALDGGRRSGGVRAWTHTHFRALSSQGISIRLGGKSRWGRGRGCAGSRCSGRAEYVLGMFSPSPFSCHTMMACCCKAKGESANGFHAERPAS